MVDGNNLMARQHHTSICIRNNKSYIISKLHSTSQPSGNLQKRLHIKTGLAKEIATLSLFNKQAAMFHLHRSLLNPYLTVHFTSKFSTLICTNNLYINKIYD